MHNVYGIRLDIDNIITYPWKKLHHCHDAIYFSEALSFEKDIPEPYENKSRYFYLI